MKSNRHVPLHGIIATSLLLAAAASGAEPVPVTNAGFENPVLTNGSLQSGTVPGWTAFNSGSIGVINPDPINDLSAEAPEGQNVAYVLGSAGETGLTQTLGSAFQADASYSLTVKVANTKFTTGFPGYRVQLLANGTVLTEEDNLQAIAEDSVATATANYTYNAGLHAGLVGQPLEIRLLSKGLATGEEVAFDDVRLTIALANPIANPGGPYTVPFNTALTLNGSASLPSDGQTISTYEWDLDNDGDFDEGITGASPATIPNATLTATPPTGFGMVVGTNTIKLKVTDSAAKTSTVETTVTLLPFIAPSLDVDFQATIASEQHPTYAGEGRYFHVSLNPANPGTGAYAATIVGTNNPAPAFVRNYDGPVIAYKFAGGPTNNVLQTAAQGGTSSLITFTTTDTSFDGFGQEQLKLWTTTDPGADIKVAGANPYNVVADSNPDFGYRSLSGATGTIDISAIPAGSVHIYYGDFNATPTLNVVMRDTAAVNPAPNITIANAHSIAGGGNGDAANRAELYLAEIDFVTGYVYDEIVFVWTAGGGNGRGFGVVVTEAPAADAVAPTLAPANIVDNSGGPIFDVTPVTYTITYSEPMDPATIGANDFELLGTASATISSVVHLGGVTTVKVLPTPGTSGTIQLQVKAGAVITDLAGNPLDTTSAITDPDSVTVNADTTNPTVVSFTSPPASGTIYGTPTITYTVAFSEFVGSLNAGNFTNGGTAASSIGTVTQISAGFPSASVYSVQVIPTGSGTVQLQVQGVIQDSSGNSLAVPVADTVVYTINTGTEPARETVTLDASTTSNLQDAIHAFVFDASASDKLVVVVTGENGNPGSLAGKVNSLTYDGVAMTKAVGRFPIGSSPSGPVDQIYNDIWYLDNPSAATASANETDTDPLTAGNIRANLDTRGVITAIRLSGTAPGVGATAISGQEVKNVSLIAGTTGGMVIASYGMGGDGNTAATQNVNTTPTTAELSAVKQGSDWNGHVTSRTSVTSPAVVASIFTGGNTIGTHTIAAEFKGALVGSGSPYTTWTAGPFAGTLTNTSASLDFDNGGLDTGIEWVVGGDPTNGSDDAGKTPTFNNSDPNNFVFSYLRRDAANTDPNTTIAVEYGTNLTGWTTATHGVNGVSIDDTNVPSPGFRTVVVTIPKALAGPGGKLFARLNVVVNP